MQSGSRREAAPLGHETLYADAAFYSAHPHVAVAADGMWLLVFTQAPRGSVVLHPPLDPRFRNMLMRSADEGRSWSVPEPVPDADMTGVECAGLTPLPDGPVLLNQWQFGWVQADEDDGAGEFTPPESLATAWATSREFAGLHGAFDLAIIPRLFPLARKGGRCRIALAADGRSPFRHEAMIDTLPFAGGYGMRGGVVLPNGEILLPLCDAPHYRQVFVLRSLDGGKSWGAPLLAASQPDAEFEEPAPILLDSGEIILVLRDNATRLLHTISSRDEGKSWSRPRSTGIADYPADLLQLQDGRLVLVAGRRRAPFGITLYISLDRGQSWGGPHLVRGDLSSPDLGYPTIVQRKDGDLAVIYYARDEGGATGIHFTLVETGLLNAWSRYDGTS